MVKALSLCDLDNNSNMYFIKPDGTRQYYVFRKNGRRLSGDLITCSQCGKEFVRSHCQIGYYKEHFCSTQCMGNFRKDENKKRRISVTCDMCGKEMLRAESKITNRNFIFCSKECRNKAISDPNLGYSVGPIPKKIRLHGSTHGKQYFCENCGKEIISNHIRFYCDDGCKREKRYKEQLNLWKSGVHSGQSSTFNVCNFVRKYFFIKFNSACQKCGWSEINPKTGRIPLVLHHVDGDASNNSESNMELLCPNCHSLTENYCSLNKNSKRINKRKHWRGDKSSTVDCCTEDSVIKSNGEIS